MQPTTANDSVQDRISTARATMTPFQALALLAFGLSIAFMLMFVQDPLVHDAMHNFRHGAGITCH